MNKISIKKNCYYRLELKEIKGKTIEISTPFPTLPFYPRKGCF